MFQSFRRLVSISNDAQEAFASTPDRLIVGHIMQSMTDNILQWSVSQPNTYSKPLKKPDELQPMSRGDRHWCDEVCCNIFKNAKLGITAELSITYKRSYQKEVWYDFNVTSFIVNGEVMDTSLGWELWCSYNRLQEAYATAQRVAREATAAMEANERKWNLAERLLKMKRTPNGRLMAVNDEGLIVGCGDPYCECNELPLPPPKLPPRTRTKRKAKSGELLAPL